MLGWGQDITDSRLTRRCWMGKSEFQKVWKWKGKMANMAPWLVRKLEELLFHYNSSKHYLLSYLEYKCKCVYLLGETLSLKHVNLLLILDICLTVDTGRVQVPVVTQQTEHLNTAARNYHRQTWSTSLNSCFDLPPTDMVTTWICWTVTVPLLAE